MTKRRFKLGLALLGLFGIFLMALLALMFGTSLASADKGGGNGYQLDGDSHATSHDPGYFGQPGGNDSGNGGNHQGQSRTNGGSGPCSPGPCDAHNNDAPGGGFAPGDQGENGGSGQPGGQAGPGTGNGDNPGAGPGPGIGNFFIPGGGGPGGSNPSCSKDKDKSGNSESGNQENCDKDTANGDGEGTGNHDTDNHDGDGSKGSGDPHDSGGGPLNITSNDPTNPSDVNNPDIHDFPPPGPNDFPFVDFPFIDLPPEDPTGSGDKPIGDGPVTTLTDDPPTEIPEPLTLSLFAAGLGGMALLRRRKNPAA